MNEPNNAEIRAWARRRGYAVADRGRIPAAVLAAYAAEHREEPVFDEEVAAAETAHAPDAPHPDAPYQEGPFPEPPAPPAAPPPQPPEPAAMPSQWAQQTRAWGPPPATPPPPPPPPPSPGPGGSPGWGPPPPPGQGWPPPAPGQGWAGGPQPPPVRPTGREGLSIPALIFGIFPMFGGLLGIIFGAISLSRIRKSGQKGRGMAIAGIVLGSLWLVGIGAAVLVDTLGQADRADDGTVTSRGSVTATDLRVGDCLSSLPERETETLKLVPCREPHLGETYATFRLSGSSYPGEDEATRFAEGGCTERLATFAGPGKEVAYEIYFLIPTSSSWRLGDREVHCLITAPGGAMLPGGSAKAKAP